MNESINARIRKIREEFCGGFNQEFARLMDRKENVISNWVREGYSVGKGVAADIEKVFNVDAKWILTGEGEMLKKDAEIAEKDAFSPSMVRDVQASYEVNNPQNEADMVNRLFAALERRDLEYAKLRENYGEHVDRFLAIIEHMQGINRSQDAPHKKNQKVG